MIINGHKIHVITQGPEGGRAVVLLHHGLGSARAWRRQALALAAAGYRVVVYDRWGYGESERRPALSIPYFEDDQDDLLTLLDHMGIQRAALIGHSDGGTIALYFAAAHPERVACLATIAAHIYVELKMGTSILSVRQIFENDANFRRRFERAHGDQYQRVFDNWFNGWWKTELLSWDMRPVLRQIHCPALVIQGLEDEHATPQHAEDIAAAIVDAELWLVPGAGHMLQRDAASELNKKLLEFLGKQFIDPLCVVRYDSGERDV
jgi:pimeloyl-ACP methyl ester carboxylesterase